MHVQHNLRPLLWACLLAWGCSGSDVAGEQAATVPASVVAAPVQPAEPMGSLSSEEIGQLAYDFKHDQLLPTQNGDSLAQLRRLSPEDQRRFRRALADMTPMDGMMRAMGDAYTEVLYEHRVSMLDAAPELMEEAVRRAFAKHSPDLPPEVVEQAVQHVLREGTPAALRAP